MTNANLLDKHRDVHAGDCDVLKNIHYTHFIPFHVETGQENLLGTMGNFAPFHSQTQKRNTTKIPDNKGAMTTADVQGNVTPPCP